MEKPPSFEGNGYEDSAQKSERLWAEYEKIAEEYKELIEVLDRDRSRQQELLEEVSKITTEVEESQNVDLSKLDSEDLTKFTENMKAVTVRQHELAEELIGIAGDIKGSFDLLKTNREKVDKIAEDLKSIGEI